MSQAISAYSLSTGRKPGTRSSSIRLLLAAALAASSALVLAASAAALTPVSVSQPKDIRPGSDSSDPISTGAADADGVLIFSADDGTILADHPDGHGIEPWRSDGTQEGTYLLKDIYQSNSVGGLAFGSFPSEFTEMDGEVFFEAGDASVAGLWKTDGTRDGTVLVKDLNSRLSELVNVDGTLYFLAGFDENPGYELWKSDGTPEGTTMVKDIAASASGNFDDEAEDFTAAGGKLFFNFETADGRELWTSDGTEDGTKQVENIDGGTGDSISVNWQAAEFEGKLYFPADDGVNGRQLWSSDGTAAGTERLADTTGGPGISMCCNTSYAVRAGELFFEAGSGVARYDLSGPAGYVSGGINGRLPTNVGGTIYFQKSFSELWRYDDTGSTATKVADVAPTLLTEFDGTLYFQASDAAFGTELWRSDGTAAGTERISDLNPGTGDSVINRLSVAGDSLFFRGDDGTTGTELWEAHSDSTPPDTTITSGPTDGSTISTDSATFAFSSSEAGSTFSCALDGGPRPGLQLRCEDLQRPRRGRPLLHGLRHRLRRQRRPEPGRSRLRRPGPVDTSPTPGNHHPTPTHRRPGPRPRRPPPGALRLDQAEEQVEGRRQGQLR